MAIPPPPATVRQPLSWVADMHSSALEHCCRLCPRRLQGYRSNNPLETPFTGLLGDIYSRRVMY